MGGNGAGEREWNETCEKERPVVCCDIFPCGKVDEGFGF